MAEYLAKARFNPTTTHIESAGIRIVPSEDSVNAVNTLHRNFGIDAFGHIPRALEQVGVLDFSIIVAIDDQGRSQVLQTLKQYVVSSNCIVPWKVPDPYGDDLSAYDDCALVLKHNLVQLERSHKLNRKKGNL